MAALKDALKRQLAELKTGLDVFGGRCSDELQGLLGHLRGMYDQTVAKMAPLLQAE